ncbi:hypothetical protein TNCV_2559631 [Trichonephila clavipes]|nr:hypothetical protein TNCV_2559631 [Trichonephila clavipes]
MNLESYFLQIGRPFGGITLRFEHLKEYYDYTKSRPQMNILSRVLPLVVKAVTLKYIGSPPVDRDRRNAHPCPTRWIFSANIAESFISIETRRSRVRD